MRPIELQYSPENGIYHLHINCTWAIIEKWDTKKKDNIKSLINFVIKDLKIKFRTLSPTQIKGDK